MWADVLSDIDKKIKSIKVVVIVSRVYIYTRIYIMIIFGRLIKILLI